MEVLRLLAAPRLLVAAGFAGLFGALTPLAVRWLLDLAIPGQSRWMVVIIAATVALGTVLVEAAKALQGQFGLWLVAGMGEELGVRAVGALALSKSGVASESDAAALGGLLAQVMDAWGAQAIGILFAAAGITSGIVALAVVGFDLAGLASLGMLLLSGAGMLLVGVRQRGQLRRIEARRIAAQAGSAAEVADISSSLSTLKTLPPGTHDLGRRSFALMNRLGLVGAAETTRWTAVRTVVRTAGSLGALVVLWLPGTRSPGVLGASVSAILVVLGAVEALLALWVSMESYWPARRRIDALAELPPSAEPGGVDPGPLREIEVRNLWFRYQVGSPWVLQGVDLILLPGEIRHIQWPSGAGKTTFLRLIAGVLRPDRGEILVNGVPLPRLDLVAYRRRLGVVTQESSLLTGTVLDILRPALPSGDVAEGAWCLLERAGVADLIRSLPLGLHTRLIQGGAGLSGGEMRRLALARALRPGVELLLLDEPLAGLGETMKWLEDRIHNGHSMALVMGHETS